MLVLVSRTKSVYFWPERFDFTYVLKNKQLLHVHHLVNPVILANSFPSQSLWSGVSWNIHSRPWLDLTGLKSQFHLYSDNLFHSLHPGSLMFLLKTKSTHPVTPDCNSHLQSHRLHRKMVLQVSCIVHLWKHSDRMKFKMIELPWYVCPMCADLLCSWCEGISELTLSGKNDH